MTSRTRPALSKTDYRCWFGAQAIFIACSGALALMLPVINSLEDEHTAMLASTPQGRWQIATSTFVSLIIVALFPAFLSYGFSRLIGIGGGRRFKENHALHMALALYATLLLCCLIGSVAFGSGRSPFNILGL